MNRVKRAAALGAGLLTLAGMSAAQSLSTTQANATWYRVGATAVAEGLASPATGQVTNVWYRGGTLLARTASGRVFETSDMTHWRLNTATIPPAGMETVSSRNVPESGAAVKGSDAEAALRARFGKTARADVTAAAQTAGLAYAGTADGRMLASRDG